MACEDGLLANQSTSSACDSVLPTGALGVLVFVMGALGITWMVCLHFGMKHRVYVHSSVPLHCIQTSAIIFAVLPILQLGENSDFMCAARPLLNHAAFAFVVAALVEYLVFTRLDKRGFSDALAARRICVAVALSLCISLLWLALDDVPRVLPCVSVFPDDPGEAWRGLSSASDRLWAPSCRSCTFSRFGTRSFYFVLHMAYAGFMTGRCRRAHVPAAGTRQHPLDCRDAWCYTPPGTPVLANREAIRSHAAHTSFLL